MNRGKALKWGLLGIKFAISIGLFVYLFRKFDVNIALREARHADPRWLWAAVGVFFTSNLCGSWLWGQLLRMQGVEIPFPKIAAYYYIGLFFNNFLPANIAGDFARISAARSHTDRAAAVFSATMMDRIIGGLAISSTALVSIALAWGWFHVLWVDALVVGLFLLCLLLYLAVFRRGILSVLEWPFRVMRMPVIERRIAQVLDELHGYRDQGKRLTLLLLAGMLIQLMRLSMHLCVARALDLHVPMGAVFTFVPILAALVLLPFSLNGIGVREGASVLLFRIVGLPGAQAISFQFLTWVLSVLVSLLGGVIFLVRTPLRWMNSRQARA